MNLTIYRGKSIKDGRIVLGGAYEVKSLHSSAFWIVDHSGIEFRVDPDSIAPATDFFDANGKRIFINDKIRFDHHVQGYSPVGTVALYPELAWCVNFPSLINNGVHNMRLNQMFNHSLSIFRELNP